MNEETKPEIKSKDNLAGVPDGHELDSAEVVVYDRDEDGNVIGWHKEPRKK